MYICIDVFMDVCICMDIYACMDLCTYVRKYIYIYIYIYILFDHISPRSRSISPMFKSRYIYIKYICIFCVDVFTDVCICMDIYACMDLCIYVRKYIYIYIYILFDQISPRSRSISPMFKSRYIYLYMCIYMYICIYGLCINMHIHTCTCKP
jgi:hypothetical protein